MTRPPFAEFSSLAVRELTAWMKGRAPWPARLDAVVLEHVSPLVGEAGDDVNEILETMDEREGELFGVALEDLCTRRYADSPANLVDELLKARGFRLPPLAKKYLEAVRDSVPSIYEIVSVVPGHGVTVRDLLVEGDPVEVIEVSGSRQLVQWDRIAARVVTHGRQHVFTGAIIPVWGKAGEALLERLRAAVHGAGGQADEGIAVEAFRHRTRSLLRGLAPVIGAAHVAEIVEDVRRPFPTLVNSDGEPYEFIEARYAMSARAAKEAAARLDGSAKLQRAGARPARWDWIGEPPRRALRASGQDGDLAFETYSVSDSSRVVLAGLKLARGWLTLSVNSRARLGRARTMIEPLLAGLVGKPEIEARSVAEAMARQERAPSARRRAVPGQAAREATGRFLDAHYRRWLDEPVPALGGSTPREAARDAEGRARLVALLKELERNEARRRREDGSSYDALWLWRELGMEHLRR